MSDQDKVDDVLERLEWDDARREERPDSKLWAATRRTALTAGAAGIAALALEACGGGKGSSTASTNVSGATFGKAPKYKFTFVNHVTTNPFFVPTRYGAADACKLLGCSYQWTGSESSNVKEMVNAMNSAVTSGTDGIAVALVDLKAFNEPTSAALKAKIPVVSYNADAEGNDRLAYIGQDLFLSGQKMGEHIVALVGGSGNVALFIATPGSLNIQPRIDGAMDTIKKSGKGITAKSVATGAALPKELSTIDAWYLANKDAKGMFAVDAGSTQGVAQTIQKYSVAGKVKGGGYDLLPPTEKLLGQKQIDFTIDQQPYLQGFLPVMELYMYKVSQTLTGLADVNTGLKFLDSTSIQPYLTTKTRYEGSSSSVGVAKS